MKSLKTLFRTPNLLLIGIVILFFQNIFLQHQVEDLEYKFSSVKSELLDLQENVEGITPNLKNAFFDAEEAAEYAKKAADYAKDARDYSFGYNCSYCP